MTLGHHHGREERKRLGGRARLKQMSTSTLAPGFLLASPQLGDPNFKRTVVLLGHHDSEGSLGWVLNGQELLPVSQMLSDASLIPIGITLPETPPFSAGARIGGPVMPGSAWLVFERESRLPEYEGEHDLGGGFAATSARAAIEALARGDGPQFFHLLLGYAGWGPGQLEGEIQRGAWLPTDFDPKLLRDFNGDSLWDAAYKSVGATPLAFTTTTRGSA